MTLKCEELSELMVHNTIKAKGDDLLDRINRHHFIFEIYEENESIWYWNLQVLVRHEGGEMSDHPKVLSGSAFPTNPKTIIFAADKKFECRKDALEDLYETLIVVNRYNLTTPEGREALPSYLKWIEP